MTDFRHIFYSLWVMSLTQNVPRINSLELYIFDFWSSVSSCYLPLWVYWISGAKCQVVLPVWMCSMSPSRKITPIWILVSPVWMLPSPVLTPELSIVMRLWAAVPAAMLCESVTDTDSKVRVGDSICQGSSVILLLSLLLYPTSVILSNLRPEAVRPTANT